MFRFIRGMEIDSECGDKIPHLSCIVVYGEKHFIDTFLAYEEAFFLECRLYPAAFLVVEHLPEHYHADVLAVRYLLPEFCR